MSKGTTLRNVRVPAELWDAALARARDDDTTLSEVIREALTTYVTTHDALVAQRQRHRIQNADSVGSNPT